MNEFEQALILADDILTSIERVHAAVELAANMRGLSKEQLEMVTAGNDMACGLLREELERFRDVAAERLIEKQQGLMH